VNERKIVVTGVVGIAILFGVAFVGIQLLGDGGPAGARPAPAVPGEPLPALPPLGAPQPAVVPTAPPAPVPEDTAPPHTVTPAAVPRPKGAKGAAPWESVDTALRPSGLGIELAAPVSDALDEARARMQQCFEDESARLGDAPPVAPKDGVYGPAVLVLHLEALDGRLSVQDSEVASEGTSSRQLIECCRRMLRSYEFEAPVAPPQRYKVQMLLQ
jgi:hypothetical protein